jgi:hypothetical protein
MTTSMSMKALGVTHHFTTFWDDWTERRKREDEEFEKWIVEVEERLSRSQELHKRRMATDPEYQEQMLALYDSVEYKRERAEMADLLAELERTQPRNPDTFAHNRK